MNSFGRMSGVLNQKIVEYHYAPIADGDGCRVRSMHRFMSIGARGTPYINRIEFQT